MNLSSVKSHIKQRLKGFCLIFIVLLAYLCIVFFSGYFPSTKETSTDDAFCAFTSALFREEAASSTLNLHFTLQNPKKYGITNIPVTFGSFSSNPATSKASIENCQASLEAFSYRALSEKNKLTYDILSSYLQTAANGTSYLLYDEPLSPITGIQAQLPVLLAEYHFKNTHDIETYLNLLETTPEFFKSLIDLEKEKAEKGLFLPDKIVDTVIEQCSSLLHMGKSHYMYTTFKDRLSSVENLTEVQRNSYIQRNETVIQDDFLPAYNSLISALEDLKGAGGELAGVCRLTEVQRNSYIQRNETVIQDDFLPAYNSLISALEDLKGAGGELAGVCRLHNGKKYYEYLAQKETGSSRSIPELKKLIQQQMQADIASLGILMETSVLPSCSFEQTPEQILKNLETKITPAFPQPADVNTEVKYVPKSMEPYLSPAFYLIPCIDHSIENTIYINRAHTMEGLKLFTTLAHEGYPGHLYQTTYFSEQNPDPLRSLLNFGGYTEGWATYAEMCSYYLAPLSKKDAALAQKNSSLLLGLYAFADVGIHYDGWTLTDTIRFFSNYGINDTEAIHALAQKNSSLLLGLYAFADVGIHYDGWTLTDTIRFFSNYGINDTEAIQEIYELIISDPANYLKYYVGYVELLELKKEIANQLGDAFSQKEFHKAVEIYELIISDPANYLKYYVGYVELLELKKEIANQLGDAFSQKEFHKAVLDVGPAPFPIVRKYVLKSCT